MKNLTFEEAAKQLDQLIHSFNKSDLTLEEALANYEEGVRLHQYCEGLLAEASNKFQEINERLK
ncbi:MAG TPA: exodeoxyribonuclease VII small subunit [Clostridiales bacterium]|jgi:exodeoxyribonuclease VII small subunit|nr:exodeoxyribonuclease VII small subunit [Clostridiales bacterium]